MRADIGREIRLAEATHGEHRELLRELGIAGGGNVLAGLGLVVYTEALGRIRLWNNSHEERPPSRCFHEFFDQMADGEYANWREEWEARRGVGLYEVLRHGMAHEYHPKVHSKFWMGRGGALGLDEDSDGWLIFRVVPYFEHFSGEIDRLRAELQSLDDLAEIPRPLFSNKPLSEHRPRYGGGLIGLEPSSGMPPRRR